MKLELVNRDLETEPDKKKIVKINCKLSLILDFLRSNELPSKKMMSQKYKSEEI